MVGKSMAQLVAIGGIFFAVSAHGRGRADWRDKNGWCEEARRQTVELFETCYGDDECCAVSSQCANGCCGSDLYCHKECFGEDGENLHGARESQSEYQLLSSREPCKRIIKNRHDEDLERVS